jgi:hypothetical protein
MAKKNAVFETSSSGSGDTYAKTWTAIKSRRSVTCDSAKIPQPTRTFRPRFTRRDSRNQQKVYARKSHRGFAENVYRGKKCAPRGKVDQNHFGSKPRNGGEKVNDRPGGIAQKVYPRLNLTPQKWGVFYRLNFAIQPSSKATSSSAHLLDISPVDISSGH